MRMNSSIARMLGSQMIDKPKGFIAIHREIFDHEAFKKSPMSEREAFIWMISRACFKDTKQRVGTVSITVPRGSFLTTLRELQHNMLWSSDKKIRGFLKTAQKWSLISTKVVGQGTQKKTQITICNYSKYQNVGRTEGSTTDAQGTNKGRTKDAVKNKGNNGNNISPSDSSSPVERKIVTLPLFSKDDLKPVEPDEPDPPPDRFPEFWEIYPHRGGARRGRDDALKRWEQALTAGVEPETIIDGARRFREDRKAIEGYAPDPARWVFRKMWLDEIETVKGQINGNGTDNLANQRSTQTPQSRNRGVHDALLAGFGEAALEVERRERQGCGDNSEGEHESDGESDSR